MKKILASSEVWTHDPWFTRPVLCHWAIEADMMKQRKSANMNHTCVAFEFILISEQVFQVHSGLIGIMHKYKGIL